MSVQTLSKFQADIRVGDVLENAVRAKLEAQGWHCVHVPGKFAYWDFAISRGDMTSKLEVKHDRLSDSTGNYCIEKRWLEHTIASILIIGTPQEAYMIPVDDVKELVKGCTDVRQVGDQATNQGYLFPKYQIIAKAKRFI
ncbi:MAG: hypothetical protein M3362_00420 [Acidobacteriota bacterium]|nr:hypothetical protein [Acidobacteriota bacterium]